MSLVDPKDGSSRRTKPGILSFLADISSSEMIGIVARHWFVKGLRFFDNVLWIVLCSSLGCNPHLYLTFWLEHPPPHPSSYPISLSRGFPGSIPTTVGSRWGANRGHVLVLQPSVLSGLVSELLQWVLEKARPSMMVFSVRLVLQVDVNIYLIHLSWTFILIFWFPRFSNFTLKE